MDKHGAVLSGSGAVTRDAGPMPINIAASRIILEAADGLMPRAQRAQSHKENEGNDHSPGR